MSRLQVTWFQTGRTQRLPQETPRADRLQAKWQMTINIHKSAAFLETKDRDRKGRNSPVQSGLNTIKQEKHVLEHT